MFKIKLLKKVIYIHAFIIIIIIKQSLFYFTRESQIKSVRTKHHGCPTFSG